MSWRTRVFQYGLIKTEQPEFWIFAQALERAG